MDGQGLKRFAGSARGIAAVVVLLLPGCESFRLFNDYQAVESPEVATAEWPRLVDVPAAPPPGAFSPAVPDPALGVAVQSELSTAAADAESRRAGAAGPVIVADERAELARRRALEQGRRPVLTPAERERLRRAPPR